MPTQFAVRGRTLEYRLDGESHDASQTPSQFTAEVFAVFVARSSCCSRLVATGRASLAVEQATLPIVDENARKDRGAAFHCLKTRRDFAADKEKFDNYFNKYSFPR